jgi:hypothetical protein
MTESMPTVEQFGDPDDSDLVEEFQPADPADPEEPETIQQDEQTELALGEADPADVAEQQVAVVEGEDDYQRDG